MLWIFFCNSLSCFLEINNINVGFDVDSLFTQMIRQQGCKYIVDKQPNDMNSFTSRFEYTEDADISFEPINDQMMELNMKLAKEDQVEVSKTASNFENLYFQMQHIRTRLQHYWVKGSFCSHSGYGAVFSVSCFRNWTVWWWY